MHVNMLSERERRRVKESKGRKGVRRKHNRNMKKGRESWRKAKTRAGDGGRERGIRSNKRWEKARSVESE